MANMKLFSICWKKGASLDQANSVGFTPFVTAAIFGQDQILNLMIEQKKKRKFKNFQKKKITERLH